MSRIHDALKAAQKVHVREAFPLVIENDAAVLERTPDCIPQPEPILEASVMPPPVEPIWREPRTTRGAITLESLRARCDSPAWAPDIARSLFIGESKDQRATEEFRTLRSRLIQQRGTMQLKSVLVASAVSGEGKSLVAWNLAQGLANQPGNSVLLVDCDLRQPQLHTYVGMRHVPGFTDYLAGRVDEFAAIRHCPFGELYFLPAGDVEPSAAELVGSSRLAGFLKRMREVFDWVVIDSPPCAPISDASRISDNCDGVLLVVLAGSTPVEVVQRGRQAFRNCPILGVVLNQVQSPSDVPSYYYGQESGGLRSSKFFQTE